ncbi:MAG: hypothetical protein MUF70_02085 [Myxococcota bacterium]|nr:hypothetical protein [Myxococcota bacterium]
MLLLRWLIRFTAALALLAGAVVLSSRYADGPLGPLPGGKLASGPFVTQPVGDWAFATGVAEIEMQLDSQSTSRTTWILVHEGRAYIPAAAEFPPGKTWHRVALEDGRAVLRIDGKRYPVQLRRWTTPRCRPPCARSRRRSTRAGRPARSGSSR